ncbi:MAG: ABC transporter ATP-binding protein [Martelella sp.]|uniref:ABC transporter ATP-binding protein n=1 Tax=unclassified Martelella TaxID=2629616 RepID=UPI000C373F1C|nr:ABC transporter ATP-binding protein [Martelella sp.]MAU21616.1 ABC transporter ATP-binding protein [Martelella sp.]|tara:strand:- start:2991 stop:4112 length:1122 start_codon:yes stop_codon:yes gene_type:complete
MTSLTVRNLSRHFGAFKALEGISFDVRAGEFLTLLGPSGCGKSTTLTALAGLDRPTGGLIQIGDRTVFDSETNTFVDAQFRNLGLMFQSYALWPHMTVYKNLDFTLELRRIRGSAARQRIEQALDMVDMLEYIQRYPGELSGGQQQRVALARTLVYQPEILLLDEPLSNLDAKLREKARLWLGDLHKKTGVTMVYVTHDQAEALSLSDRIIVMNRGRIAQIGAPLDVYEQPADLFVADFVGASNILSGTLLRDGSGRKVRIGNSPLLDMATQTDLPDGPVMVSIRPEAISPVAEPSGKNSIPYMLHARSYLGSRALLVLDVAGSVIRVETDAKTPNAEAGHLFIPPEAIRVFPLEQADLLPAESRGDLLHTAA